MSAKFYGLCGIRLEEMVKLYEMLKAAGQCRFTPCTHTHEPGCAVKSAVDNVETVEYVAYAEEMNVVVNGVESHNVAVYDATGRLVKMINNASSDIERINVQAAGVYIIRIDNNQTLRVVVK